MFTWENHAMRGLSLCPIGTTPKIATTLTHDSHFIHRGSEGKLLPKVKNRARGAVYPPKTSVSLFSNRFKSLSDLRASVIFSTECNTVV